MTMLLIAKELAQAVVKSHCVRYQRLCICSHCESEAREYHELQHTSECIVTRAKLLLEQEWGIKL